MGKIRITIFSLCFVCVSTQAQHQDSLTGAGGETASSATTTPAAKDAGGSNDTLYNQIDKDYKAALAKVSAGATQKKATLTQKGSGSLASSLTKPTNLKMGALDSNAAINDVGKGGAKDPLSRQQIATNNKSMATTDAREAFMGPACDLRIAPGGIATVSVPKTGLIVPLPLLSFQSAQQQWDQSVNYKFRDISASVAMAGVSAGARPGGSIIALGNNTLPLSRWGVTNDLSNYYYGDQALVAQADQAGGYASVRPDKILLRIGRNSTGQPTCAVVGGGGAGAGAQRAGDGEVAATGAVAGR